MYRALAIKELREVALMGAVCLLGMLLVMCDEMGLEFDWSRLFFVSRYAMQPNYYNRVPFVEDSLDAWIAILGGTLALALGFWQTLGETFRKTWSFLWHRPMQRQHVTYVKLSVGAAVFAGAMCLPLLILAVWASLPGTHPSPFGWWMTEHAWRLVFALTPLYLAAFLCGVREARWYGSRLLPLGMAAVIAMWVYVTSWWAAAGWLTVVFVDAMFVAGILRTFREQDIA
jgi:hypothetical protein